MPKASPQLHPPRGESQARAVVVGELDSVDFVSRGGEVPQAQDGKDEGRGGVELVHGQAHRCAHEVRYVGYRLPLDTSRQACGMRTAF